MEKKKQTIRFSDAELDLIKVTFAENEDLLKAIRKHFLQLPLDPIDQEMMKQVKGKVVDVVRKSFLPELDGNAPFNQVIDLWMTLEIREKKPEDIEYLAPARAKLIAYLDQQLLILEGKLKEPKILFKDLITGEDAVDLYQNLTVRNTVIAHTEMQINQLYILAGLKDETLDQTRERLMKDSSK